MDAARHVIFQALGPGSRTLPCGIQTACQSHVSLVPQSGHTPYQPAFCDVPSHAVPRWQTPADQTRFRLRRPHQRNPFQLLLAFTRG